MGIVEIPWKYNCAELSCYKWYEWFLGVRVVRSSPTGDVRLDIKQYLEKALESSDYSEQARRTNTPMDLVPVSRKKIPRLYCSSLPQR